jgi:hypothetical protein
MTSPPDKLYRVYGETRVTGSACKGTHFVHAPNEVVARKLAQDHWPCFKIERIQEIQADG